MTPRFAALLLLAPAGAAAAEEYDTRAIEARKPRELTQAPRPGEPFFEAGRRVFFQRCAPCHGVRGAGDGHAAPYLDPRPRDFTTAVFKLRSTSTGEFPTDADLFRTVSRGVPGTAMPAWGEGTFRLSELERWQAVYFVKHLGRDFWNAEFDPYGKTSDGVFRVVDAPAPPPVMAERLEKGQRVFLDEGKGACVKCHGALGRGDGKQASSLKDDWGDPVLPADLTKPWRYKNGASVQDVFRTFTTGLNGTPMPGFDKTIPSEEDRWNLAMYVQSLQRPPARADDPLLAAQVEGPLPEDPDDPQWKRSRPLGVWLGGQVIVGPRWASPSVDYVEVQALHDGAEIALLLSWNDRFKNDRGPAQAPRGERWQPKDSYVPARAMRERAETEALPDQLAMHFPTGSAVPGRVEKPHFFMGEGGRRVSAWLWRADREGAVEANATGPAKGYLSQGADSQSLRARASFDNGRWQLVLRRALATPDGKRDAQFGSAAPMPFALRVWDGAAGEWDLQSAVSSWHYVKLEARTPPIAYLGAFLVFGAVAAAEVAVVRTLRRPRRTETRSAGE